MCREIAGGNYAFSGGDQKKGLLDRINTAFAYLK